MDGVRNNARKSLFFYDRARQNTFGQKLDFSKNCRSIQGIFLPIYFYVSRAFPFLSLPPSLRLLNLRNLRQGAYPYLAKQILNENKPEMVSLLKVTLINDDGNIAWRRLEQLVSTALGWEPCTYSAQPPYLL